MTTSPILRHLLTRAAVLLACLPAALALAAPPTTAALPPDWYPESLVRAPDGTMYAGSWRQGAIARLAPGASTFEQFIPPGSNGLANVQGLLVDAQAGILWACSGDLGHTTVPTTPSALKSFDLATGRALHSYAMPDAGYCNDLAQDSHGTLYVTDSRHPRILRLRRSDTALVTWLEHPALGTGELGFHLNGIALDGDSTLYVSAVAAVPWILRVQVRDDAAPGPVEQIAMPRMLKNADALRVYAPGRLAIFESDAFGKDGAYGGQISLARIHGTRASLSTVVQGLNNPSSGWVDGERIWFIESKYALLLRGEEAAVPKDVPFDVMSIGLRAAEARAAQPLASLMPERSAVK